MALPFVVRRKILNDGDKGGQQGQEKLNDCFVCAEVE